MIPSARGTMGRVGGFAILEAPSVLGLFPRGVERLPGRCSTPVWPRRSMRGTRDE